MQGNGVQDDGHHPRSWMNSWDRLLSKRPWLHWIRSSGWVIVKWKQETHSTGRMQSISEVESQIRHVKWVNWLVCEFYFSKSVSKTNKQTNKNPQSLCLISDTIFILPMKKSEDLSMPVTFKSSPIDFNMHP